MSYLIEVPQNEEECLKALDEQLEKGSDILDKFYFGCMTGDHTAYAIMDLKNEGEARNLIPGFLLDKSIITEVGRFTPEMIRSFHKKAA
jgi:hypothetical protein